MQADYTALSHALRRILEVNLEARLVLCELRRASLNFEIDSSTKTPEERTELIAMRDAALTEWGEVMTELEALKAEKEFPCQ